jgi:GT2 family glycosyltransferase
MTDLPVSVVVVSRGRPAALSRCLKGLAQQFHGPFEVIVVADPQGCAAARADRNAERIKICTFDEANISAARNLGIAEAAGEIVAFIDDDAVPEPTWLRNLAAPFAEADVAAAGGYVRGRNGLSWQWTAQSVDRLGQAAPLRLEADAPVVLSPARGRAIRTEGTNMALRRSVLTRLGGFDPNFHYFLDETDLNLRLAERDHKTAIVPRAVVHHGYAANAVRSAGRVPRDLTQIGASWAVFLAKHAPRGQRAARWAQVCASERARALDHMVRGHIEPRDVRRLMATLHAGYAEGRARAPSDRVRFSRAANGLSPLVDAPPRGAALLSGRSWSRASLAARAAEAAARGEVATVIRLSPTALYHRVRFTDAGYWDQSGGLYGRSDRADPLVAFWRFGKRVRRETATVAELRGLTGNHKIPT